MRPWSLALFAAIICAWPVSSQDLECDSLLQPGVVEESCPSNETAATQLVLHSVNCVAALERKVLRLYTPDTDYLGLLFSAGQLYTGASGYNITVDSGVGSNYTNLDVARELSRDVLSYYDGFVIGAEILPVLAVGGLAAPLDAYIMQDPAHNWFRISRYYRGFSVLHEQQTYGVPLSGVGMLTFYRKDVFQDLGMSVPVTWDEVLDMANGWRSRNLAGLPPYAFCAPRGSYCGKNLLLSIAATIIQNDGPSSGFLIDPSSGDTFIRSAGFLRAMEIWQQLEAHGPQSGDPQDECAITWDSFSNGSCLVTVQAFHMFKVYAGPGSLVRDKLGVALPLGSSRVLNRTSGQVENCTEALCKKAIYMQRQQQQSTTAPSNSSASYAWVNYAPFMRGGLLGVVNSRNPSEVQAEVVRYFGELSSGLGLRNALLQNTDLAPFRTDHWTPATLTNWTDAGYHPAAAVAAQAALSSLYESSNLAPTLRLLGRREINAHLADAVEKLANGGLPASIAAELDEEIKGVLGLYFNSTAADGSPGYLEMYRSQVGYQVEETPSPPPPSYSPPRGPTVSRQTIVVIAVVTGTAGLLAAVVALEVRNKRQHKNLLGRVKPPQGDPDTTIVVASIQDFDELWEALISDASERALQQFGELVELLLRRHSGYRAPSEEEDVVVAFHCPRDACEFALDLQRGLLELRWPRHVLEMDQFKPQYMLPTNTRGSFSNGARGAGAPISGAADDDDKLFSLATRADNVRSFGEQCVASWVPAEANTHDAELAFCGIRARVGLCAVGFTRLTCETEPGLKRKTFSGEAVDVAAAAAAAAQGGMVLIPQGTFRQLHLEVLAEQCLFCHLGEYQLTAALPPMDLYLALDRQLLGRLALFGPLTCHLQWSQGAFAAPVHNASMVFTHLVGVQTLLAWDYDLMQDVIETFTRMAQVELQQAGGYLVEHVEGFMLTAFHSPADAILWGLRMQEVMLKEDWPEELLAHELCEEVTVTVPVRGGEVTSATVFRGPRLKTGIDIGQVLARLHTMTGRMTYRGKVMNRAARISAAASSGQVLCSAEAWESCTASASALRLVTATSLGLFQLKGIQERIEVFHCTYQRHVTSSTRRSSTVSVGLVSSSDNRRKSAIALSSASHLSHHTTSYRSSMPNSSALEHPSASEGRRGSAVSSAQPLGHGSVSGALHSIGLDQVPVGVLAGVGGGIAVGLASAGLSPARHRSVLLLGDAGAGTVANGVVGGVPPSLLTVATGRTLSHTSQHSQRSHGSNGATGAARAALAAVLQSRTRSASALHTGSGTLPFRSNSARGRRAGAMAAAVAAAADAASEQQVSVAAAAVATAAAGRCFSPKAAASLDYNHRVGIQRSVDEEGGTPAAGYLSGNGGGGGTGELGVASTTVYTVLPSVVLSGGVMLQQATSHLALIDERTAHEGNACGEDDDGGHEGDQGVTAGGLNGGASVVRLPNGGGSSSGGGGGSSAVRDVQLVTITARVDDVLLLEGGEGGNGSTCEELLAGQKRSLDQLLIPHPPQHQSSLQSHPQSQSRPNSEFKRPVHSHAAASSQSHLQHQSSAATATAVTQCDAADEVPCFDKESRVETLEVTVSANGIGRGLVSSSSANFVGGLASSNEQAVASRAGSVTAATAPFSYLFGLNSRNSVSAAAGGAVCSRTSSGLSTVTGTSGLEAATRSQSATSAAGALAQGMGAAQRSAGADSRQSRSNASVELFLPLPAGEGGTRRGSGNGDDVEVAGCDGPGNGGAGNGGWMAAVVAAAVQHEAEHETSAAGGRSQQDQVGVLGSSACAATAATKEEGAAAGQRRGSNSVDPVPAADLPRAEPGSAETALPRVQQRESSLITAGKLCAEGAESPDDYDSSGSDGATDAVAASGAGREDSSSLGAVSSNLGVGGGPLAISTGSGRLRPSHLGSGVSPHHTATTQSQLFSSGSMGSLRTLRAPPSDLNAVDGVTAAAATADPTCGRIVDSTARDIEPAPPTAAVPAAAAAPTAVAGPAPAHRLRIASVVADSENAGGVTKGAAGAAATMVSSFGVGPRSQSGASDYAAAAAAFGVGPPPPPAVDYASAAAAFGVGPPPATDFAAFGIGPPVGEFDCNGGGHVVGPTREQLERALELLGESRHGGSGWH